MQIPLKIHSIFSEDIPVYTPLKKMDENERKMLTCVVVQQLFSDKKQLEEIPVQLNYMFYVHTENTITANWILLIFLYHPPPTLCHIRNIAVQHPLSLSYTPPSAPSSYSYCVCLPLHFNLINFNCVRCICICLEYNTMFNGRGT